MTQGMRWKPRIKRRQFYVYILANESRMLYVGMTNNIETRVSEHKQKLIPGYTATYNIHRLVYYEDYAYVWDAIAREKQLKRWLRARKVALIEADNPSWSDLAADWYT
jgi:putative endonuclease